MGGALAAVVSSCVLFFSINASLRPAAANEPRPVWKILQIDAKKSSLRTTSNQMYNGKLVQCMWDDDDKFGIGPNVFFPFSPGKKS